MTPDPGLALMDATRRYVAAYWPGRVPVRLVAFLDGGGKRSTGPSRRVSC